MAGVALKLVPAGLILCKSHGIIGRRGLGRILTAESARVLPELPLAGGVDIDFGGVVIGPVGDTADDRVRLCGTGDGGIASGAGWRNIGAVLKDIEPLDGHRGRVVDGGRVAGSVAWRGFDGEALHAFLGGGGRVICRHAIGGIGGGGAGVGILGRRDNRIGKAVGGIGRRSV